MADDLSKSVEPVGAPGPLSSTDGVVGDGSFWQFFGSEGRGAAQAQRAAPRPGAELLVLSSNSRRTRFLRGEERGLRCWAEYSENGRVAKIARSRRPGRAAGGVRSAITGFSRRARRALLVSLNSIDSLKAPAEQWVFVTLTYHRADVSPWQCKEHFDRFSDRFAKRFKKTVQTVWKLEPQERGTPHLHLLIHLDPGVDHESCREFTKKVWHELADPDSPEHLKVMEFKALSERHARRDFWQPLKSWNQVAGYAAKYFSKPVTADWAFPGRYWGIRNRRQLPRCIRVVELSDAAAIWSQRQMARYLEHVPTGRVDVIGKGQRITLSKDRIRSDPTFLPGQKQAASVLGFKVKAYRYKPSRIGRTRQAFIPSAVVSRIVEEAQKRFPISQAEAQTMALAEAEMFARRFTEDARAAKRLHEAMPRIAAHMKQSKLPIDSVVFARESFWKRPVQRVDESPVSNEELVIWLMTGRPGPVGEHDA